MSLQLILGSAGSGKSYQMYHEIISKSKQNIHTNYLVIVPEQFTLQTQKDIVTMHPSHGVMNVDILSFLRFAYRIFDEVGVKDYPILEDTGKSMVLRRVVSQKKKDLILFGSNIRKPGFINELKSLLSELYQYNVSASELERMKEITEKKPVLKAKIHDIATIYQGFQEFIRDRYITAEEILVVLSEIIEQSQWLRNSVICLDGFTGFTPCQYNILGQMMKLAKKVYITVTLDPREDLETISTDHQLFSLSKKTIHKLYQLADENNVLIDLPLFAEEQNKSKVPFRFIASPALASLEHNLFRYPYERYEAEQKDITIHTTRDAYGEVAFVSREIKRLIREEGYRYQDIAVVTGDIEQYSPVVKRIFQQAKIPCFIDYKKEILNNPFVELLRSAIAIANEDYSYESVFRYLRTGLSKLSTEDIDLLENYIIATGIRGHKRWKEPFVRTYKTKVKINLDQINAARAQFLEEIQPLYIVLKDKENTLNEYTKALYELGVRLHIEQQLQQYSQWFQDKNIPLAAKEFDQIYRIVMELYDQMVLLLGEEQVTLKEFSEIIETGLVEAKVGLIPPGIDEVVIGDTERTRLKDIKALFFIGVNDGIVPKTMGSGGILSDIERELLIEYDLELAPTRRQLAFTEQFYIYLNMTKPKNKLYITFHKLNLEGKSVRPSYLVGKLMQLIKDIKVMDEEDYCEDIEHILGDQGLSYLAKGLREFSNIEVTNLWKELYLYYRTNENTAQILEKLTKGAFYKNEEKGISKSVAQFLYGQELKGSVTRMERYAGCPFAHFLAYGLSLEERCEYKLAIPDVGNIFHHAIDDFSKRLDDSNYNWHNIPETTREAWAKESVEKAVEEYQNSFLKSNKRNEYLIKRIERITIRTLWALCNQIKQGVFEPTGYEMPFYHIPSDNLTLRGRIDRLDLYEEEDKLYVRVVDYKSGHTTFDIPNIYYGLQQQLAVYLSAAMDYLMKKEQNKKIIPSGIFYYHIDDPIVAKSEQVEEEIYKALKMNGLVNKDDKIIGLMDKKIVKEDDTLRSSVKSDVIPIETNKEGMLNKRSSAANENQIRRLMDFVNKSLTTEGMQILEGEAQISPYKLKDRTACDYCEYKSVCGFDCKLPGHDYRLLGGKSVEEMKQEIWGES